MTYDTVIDEPGRREIKREITHTDEEILMMSEIGDGVFVEWGQCRLCMKRVQSCRCANGPTEPAHIKRWREARLPKAPDVTPILTQHLADALEADGVENAAERASELTTQAKEKGQELRSAREADLDDGLERARLAIARAQEESDVEF